MKVIKLHIISALLFLFISEGFKLTVEAKISLYSGFLPPWFWSMSKLTYSLTLTTSSLSLCFCSVDRSCNSRSMCFHTGASLWSSAELSVWGPAEFRDPQMDWGRSNCVCSELLVSQCGSHITPSYYGILVETVQCPDLWHCWSGLNMHWCFYFTVIFI